MNKFKVLLIILLSGVIVTYILQFILKENIDLLFSLIGLLAAVCTLIGLILSKKAQK